MTSSSPWAGSGRHHAGWATFYGARFVAVTEYDSDVLWGGAVVRRIIPPVGTRVSGVMADFGEVAAPDVPGADVQRENEPRAVRR